MHGVLSVHHMSAGFKLIGRSGGLGVVRGETYPGSHLGPPTSSSQERRVEK